MGSSCALVAVGDLARISGECDCERLGGGAERERERESRRWGLRESRRTGESESRAGLRECCAGVPLMGVRERDRERETERGGERRGLQHHVVMWAWHNLRTAERLNTAGVWVQRGSNRRMYAGLWSALLGGL
jgi:hypothetical protein